MTKLSIAKHMYILRNHAEKGYFKRFVSVIEKLCLKNKNRFRLSVNI